MLSNTRVRAVVLGFLIASFAWAVPYFVWYENTIVDPNPYNVVSIQYKIVDKSFAFKGAFEKLGCEFAGDGVFASYLGNIEPIPYTYEAASETNEIKGGNPVLFRTAEITKRYEWIEYRTRHRCTVYINSDGKRQKHALGGIPTTILVDKVFARVSTLGKLTAVPNMEEAFDQGFITVPVDSAGKPIEPPEFQNMESMPVPQ